MQPGTGPRKFWKMPQHPLGSPTAFNPAKARSTGRSWNSFSPIAVGVNGNAVAYVAADGTKQRPVMVHHAVLGSIERFIAVLLEHYDGKLPLWLAPDQIVVAPITDAQNDYATWCLSELQAQDFRAVADLRHDRIGRKVADAKAQGVPVVFAVGAREETERTVSMRKGDGPAVVVPLAHAMFLLRREAFK